MPYTGFGSEQPLLAIDGYSVGILARFADVADYVHFLRLDLLRVEIYIGESAAWWSGNRARIVVNILTHSSSPAATGERSPQREEAHEL